MIFEYNEQSVFTKSVDIVDIGNFSLRCESDEGADYYICVKTVMGKTAILKFGPCIPDCDILPDEYNLSYKKIDYKESKIGNELNKLLNDPKKCISETTELTEVEVLDRLPKFDSIFIEGDL